jgi:hypothetical protein
MVGTMTAIALAVTAASAAAQAKGQLSAGKAAKQAGESQQQVAEANAQQSEFNAHVADLQAADATTRGAEEESRFRTSVRGLIGSQRAGFAGQGVDVGSGSALDVQADAAYLGELDALTIRSNAAREAWGYQVQSENYRQDAAVQRKGGEIAARAGANANSAAKIGAAGSVLGAGSSLLLSRYGWNDSATTKPRGPNVSALPPAYMRGV